MYRMALILQAEDVDDWIYRGEGAANLVLGYRGSSPAFIGKVLRVHKAPVNGYLTPEATFSLHEHLLWEDVPELLEAKSIDVLSHLYVLHVMKPLLGHQYVDPGMQVVVSKEFLELIEKNVLRQRPVWRVDAAKVNTSCDSALLISDHSVFPSGGLQENISMAVEIKPKWGFLPSSQFIAEANSIKKSVSRFKMHQALRLHQGKITHMSKYDPLDLFSTSTERISRALKALLDTPQNNFRVFLNGCLIFGDDNHECHETLELLLKRLFHIEHGRLLTIFLELITETIYRSKVLNPLLKVQKLDSLDIEGAVHAYYNIVSQPCMVCKTVNNVDLLQKYSTLHSLSLEESLRIVREYLIAGTAKDCSLMISFRPTKDGYRSSPNGSIFLESIKQDFDYKAFFIDLDMKPLRKMPYYYELDQKILNCYKKHMEKI